MPPHHPQIHSVHTLFSIHFCMNPSILLSDWLADDSRASFRFVVSRDTWLVTLSKHDNNSSTSSDRFFRTAPEYIKHMENQMIQRLFRIPTFPDWQNSIIFPGFFSQRISR